MPKQTPLICNMNAGELSPLVDARADIGKYANGCRTLENFIPLVEGGIIRCPGTYFVKEVKDSLKKTRLQSFHFSTIQSYIIEQGDLYFRFFKDEGRIVIDLSMDAWSAAVHYYVGEYTKLAGVVYQCIVANTNKSPDTNPAYWTAKVIGDPVEIVTPYTENEIFQLNGPQSADTLYIFHASHPPMKLIRHSHINWELVELICYDSRGADITFIPNSNNPIKIDCPGHHFAQNDYVFFHDIEGISEMENTIQQVQGVPEADSFYINLDTHTFSPYISGGKADFPITAITQDNPAEVTMLKHGFNDGDYVFVTDIAGMTELNNRVFIVANKTSTTFELQGEDSSLYNAYISGGTARKRIFYATDEYPSCGAFFEQRLYKAGTNNNPQTVYGSAVGDYENHNNNPTLDDAALEYTIPGALNKVDRIRWMTGEDYLLIGTSGAIHRLGATTTTQVLTQTNVTVKVQIGLGVAEVEPLMVIDAILWLTRGKTSVRQIMWSEAEGKYVSPDMTRLARHIAYGTTLATSGILQMAFQKEQMPISWGVRADGQLIGMTYEIQEQVYAWFRLVTDGLFESVAVISKDGEEDQIWVICNRTIGGVSKRYVEYFTPQNFYSLIADAFFVHSGLTTTLVAATQISGLLHLAGKSVDVVIAGVYIGRKTVSVGGVVTLGGTYSGKAHVGLPFTSKAEPMKLNVGSNLGTARGKRQRINDVTVALYETCGGKIGPDATTLRPIDVNAVDGVLVTDDYEVEFPGDWHDDATLCIIQDEPYPMTVLALVPRVALNE